MFINKAQGGLIAAIVQHKALDRYYAMLSLSEEILLLALDDASGRLLPLPERALDIALSATVVMGLHNEKRIEVTPPTVTVLDNTPTGDTIFDEMLRDIEKHPQSKLSGHIHRISGHANHIRKATLENLVKKNVLECKEEKVFWILPSKRYPLADDHEEVIAKERIRNVLLEGKKAKAWDIDMIALLEACDLLRTLLSKEELEAAQERIKELESRDPIGIAVIESVAEVQHTFNEVLGHGTL